MSAANEPTVPASKALDRAAASLSRSPCTRARLIERLAKQGFAERAASDACDELERLGYLSDQAIAESVVRGILSSGPAGKRLILSRLLARGVPRELADRVTAQALEGTDAHESALTAARSKMRQMPPALEKQAVVRRVTSYLARRGIDAGVCREAVRCAWNERETG